MSHSDAATKVRGEIGDAQRARPGARWLWLSVVALVSVAVGAHGLTESFWRDETYSAELASRPLGLLLRTLGTTDAPHGTYYVFLHFWTAVSTSETWIRIPSLVAFVGAVALAAELGRRRFGYLSGTAVAALLVGNPLFSYYAHEARPYALAALLLTGAAAVLLWSEQPPGTARWIGFTVLSVGAVYMSIFTLIGVAALLAGVSLMQRRLLKAALVAGAAVLAASAPLLWVAKGQAELGGWIGSPGLRDAAYALLGLLGSPRIAVFAFLLLAVAVVLSLRQPRTGDVHDVRPVLIPSAAAALAQPGLLLLVSVIATPVFVPRYGLAVIPLAALAAAAICWAPSQRIRLTGGLAALGVVGIGLSLTVADRERPNDAAPAAEHILTGAAEGDCIAYSQAWARPGVDYYLRQGSAAPLDVPVMAGGQTARAAEDLYAHEGDPSKILNQLESCQRVWVVGYDDAGDWHPVPDVGSQAVETLRPAATVTDEQVFDGLRVELLDLE